jgi:S-formylglutathione hydrolase FrmB
MESAWWIIAFWVDGLGLGQAPTALLGRHQFERVNRQLHGQLLDFTNNHGHDRRLWSPSLGQKRDLYVYLPPGFDARKRYPLLIFLHGAAQDEEFFLQTQVEHLDRAVATGQLPPAVVVAPDGSLTGKVTLSTPATFWANSRAGRFEDWVMQDVWNFVMTNFPVAPHRDAHALVGASMGGSAAFALAIKHRDRVKAAMGFHPLLNLRYVDCHGKYRTRFDPCCWGLREHFHGWEPVGRRRFFVLRYRDLFQPLFGRGPCALQGVAAINPLELMEATDLRPGELDLYVAYGGKDEFNVGAQVESFLWQARHRGVEVTVQYDPNGKHDLATSFRMMPRAMQWAKERIAGVEAAGRCSK